MASLLCAFSSPFLISNSSLISRKSIVTCEKLLVHKNQVVDVPTTTTSVRRSGSYAPSLWSYDHIQSLTSKYTGEKHMPRLQTLKEAVRTIIYKDNEKEENPLKMLNLVDDLQRLGISYHFENEISNVLKNIYHNYFETSEKWTKMDLNTKALGFRILRQHGYHIPQEIFEDIKDDAGNFKGHLQTYIIGMLNLYEASYLSIEDENILDDARDFTTKYLKECLENNISDQHLSTLISHALDIPLQWMVPRVESRWFIEAYEKRTAMNPTLLELAKLDFNILQAIHLEDLKDTSRWWKKTRWDSNLTFLRDRLVENFLWTIGTNSLPQFSPLRRILAQVFALITSFDDVYDVYGTLEELEQFTEAISRWDISSIDELPEYMKICFIGFYNSINEITYYTLTDIGFFNLPYLKKGWEGLCKAYLKEAQWYYSGYKPTFEEYLENAIMSISLPLMLTHISFLTSVTSTDEIMNSVERTENVIRYSSIILRLADDLATYTNEMSRGDTPKSVQCYMLETGATEDEARMYVKTFILNTWKKLNKERSAVMSSQFLKEITECGTNLGRMAQFMYHEGDGHGHDNDVTKSHVLSLLVNPI
ncbi:(-)-beta-pinene synthase, chloroplastic-like [Bidens hawaiensis]|uniref:(-)-beta-pinene synthase, chloroplastic-like n=1 Tax=Bidens hawaiensis TaxID=980011 RepID=UPI00404B4D8F